MSETERPAHRPSRRQHIVSAAVRVFGRNGLADASMQDIADEAGVAATAVYYHFSGKEELFDLALRRVLDQLDEVVRRSRADDEPGDADRLATVIDAVWDWLEDNPDDARMYQLHLAGATGQARVIREEFEQRHVQRAFDYLSDSTPRNARSAAVRHAAQTLAVRTMITSTMHVSALRAEGGPLSTLPQRSVRRALRGLAQRIVAS
ncbi:TetR/AcrR family transcriptional regulator [Actinophytocola sp.]|uniref:TetR/AcrR family transcriptional regulator n=1 Tax=Actinophytocola sp. TaxID=1872138 RepID=UPI002ECFFE68